MLAVLLLCGDFIKVKAASFKCILNNILKGYCMLPSLETDVERKFLCHKQDLERTVEGILPILEIL